MAQSRRVIPRRDLYELVWKTAMSKLAPEFGLSGNGLARLCRRHDIPVPDRGYWAKIQHGKHVKHPPLPAVKIGQSEDIAIEGSGPGVKAMEAAMSPIIAEMVTAERGTTGLIPVPQSPKPHPIIAAWPKPQKPSYGVPSFTPAVEVRRRRLATVLFREIEKRGGTIVVEDSHKFTLSLLGASVKVTLRERTRMVDVPADPKRSYSYARKEFHPTGLLRLRFEEYFDVPVRREWNETEDKPLETKLRDILIGWLLAIEAERQRNERFAREAARRDEERRRYEQIREERRLEQERIHALVAEAKAWEDATRIRTYVEAVAVTGNATDAWKTWARAVADALDPTVPSAS